MERWIAGAVVILFVAAVLALMFRAWARRRRSQQVGFPLPAVPAQLAEGSEYWRNQPQPGAAGAARLPSGMMAFDAQFVAVTFAGRPLERIAAHGLGYRGAATVVVVDRPDVSGVLVEVDGSSPLWLAGRTLRGVGRGTWAIDRVVEPGGLVVVTAGWNGVDVDIYLGPQFAPPSSTFIAAVGPLLVEAPLVEAPLVEAPLVERPDSTPAPGAAA